MAKELDLITRYRKRYHTSVGMNLRMDEALATALRELAEETGRSQQDLAREAIAEYVRDYPLRAFPKNIRHMLIPPVASYRPVAPEERIPPLEGWDWTEVIREMRGDR